MEKSKRVRINNETLDLKYKYADEWLDQAVELYRHVFASAGYTLPKVYVSAGFSDYGYREGGAKNVIGICYARSLSTDESNQIFISPIRTDPVDVLSILGHELIHAVDDCKNGHKKPFYDIAKNIGHWDSPKLSFHEMRKFLNELEAMAVELGRYPRTPLLFNA